VAQKPLLLTIWGSKYERKGDSLGMKRIKLFVSVFAALALVGAFALAAGAETVVLFEDDFDGYLLKDHWVATGAIEPFNRVEVFDGALEFEGSFGNEGFGVWAKPVFELLDGPITIEVSVTRNASADWQETTIWFIHEWLPNMDPWVNGTFLRVMMLSQGRIVIQREHGRGVGRILAEAQGWPPGEREDVQFTIDDENYKVVVNGVTIAEGAHDLPFTTGYLYIADWNSLAGDIDYIHHVRVVQER
jgi:hypothetical protein